MPAMFAQSSRYSVVTAWLQPVWCAPPARIHAAQAVLKSGRHSQTARATGRRGSFGALPAISSEGLVGCGDGFAAFEYVRPEHWVTRASVPGP